MKFLGAVFIFLVFVSSAYGGGKTEEAAADPVGKEWVLCVSSFDVSALPASRRIVGEVLAVDLVNYLSDISYRIRMSPEYAYYESTAWLRARHEAGGKLAQKRNQRDELLFKGNAGWRYEKDLKTIDKEIITLEEEYAAAESKIPAVETKPDFHLTQDNLRGVFPPAPKPGGEYNFCVTQKADGLLTGQISEYHGRIYLVVRVYAIYARSVVYEDSVLFSSEDINDAMQEVGNRLVMALEGTPRASVAVTANPETAVISFDNAFAGRGRVEPVERAPGQVEVRASAPDHVTTSVTVDLFADELAELQINLSPLGSSLVLIDVPDYPGTAVYQGSLFIGNTPLELGLATNHAGHISVETPEGNVGSAIIPAGDKPEDAALYLAVIPPLEEGRLDRSRRGFYGAWGRFWIALPLAWMASGVASTVIGAYNTNQFRTKEQYDEAQAYRWVSVGLTAVAAGFALESVVRAFFYVRTSSKGEPRTSRNWSQNRR
ncbi:MAG: hypothetical protein LBI91_04755 [Spirochaetaceae bacterium]|nr:hypothetical protein [Spirochaetaceae bacterium]